MKQTKLASYAIIIILALAPFGTLLSTWAGSNFGHLDLFRIWDTLLLIPLGLYAAYLVTQDRKLTNQWSRSWLVQLILGYALLSLGFGIAVLARHQVTPSAVIYSWVTNLRFLAFFLITWAVATHDNVVYRHWRAILFIPAAVVVVFGLLQRIILPADYLRHFGYSSATINPIETIDQKLSLRRVQSSLRGANPLGAYLIVVLTGVVSALRRGWYYCVLAVAGTLGLYTTYSRSAWIGLVLALATLALLRFKNPRIRTMFVLVTAILVLLGIGLVASFRHNDTVQNVLFHTDEKSQSLQSSNEVRSGAVRQGLQNLIHQPIGAGPGTAGPASQRNVLGLPRIAENYFIQIGQEVGLIGLTVFIVINILVASRLYRQKTILSYVLLASLVGITFVNMVSHAWADGTLSMIWWGLAGVAVGTPVILKGNKSTKRANHGPKSKKTSQKTATA